MTPTALRPVGPCPASIMIVGEFPSEADVNTGIVFCGSGPGAELGRMLQDAGIFKSSCFQTVFLRDRPPKGDVTHFIAEKKKQVTPAHMVVRDKHALPVVAQWLEVLSREIELCQPNVIIALGNAAIASAVIGTVGTRVLGRDVPSLLTTPEAPDLHGLFAMMRERSASPLAICPASPRRS